MATKTTMLAPSEAPTGEDGVSLGVRLANVIVVIAPFLGLVAACVLAWGWGFRWMELCLMAGMYVLTGLGITVGYHRLFTHRSFETSTVMQFVLAVCGSMAAQGPLLHWVAFHRRHHQFSDREGDPHSPHHCGPGILGVVRGWCHAHFGWIFRAEPNDLLRYVKDLQQSTSLRVVSALFPFWVGLGLFIPTVLGFLLVGD